MKERHSRGCAFLYGNGGKGLQIRPQYAILINAIQVTDSSDVCGFLKHIAFFK